MSSPIFGKTKTIIHIPIDMHTILEVEDAEGEIKRKCPRDCCCGLQGVGSLISHTDSLFNIKCQVTVILIRDLIFKLCSAGFLKGVDKQQQKWISNLLFENIHYYNVK